MEIEKLLEKYYKKRKEIENSFSYKYNCSVEKRVQNLTTKYSKLLSNYCNNTDR